MNVNDPPNTTCLTPGCLGRLAPANGRGLCMKCYASAKQAVKSGRTTWDILEEIGLVLRKEDPFTKALNEATKLHTKESE